MYYGQDTTYDSVDKDPFVSHKRKSTVKYKNICKSKSSMKRWSYLINLNLTTDLIKYINFLN